MIEIDFRLLGRRIDVLEAEIREIEGLLDRQSLPLAHEMELRAEIGRLHRKQLACIRREGELQRWLGGLEPNKGKERTKNNGLAR